jgi:hypothetical protein
MNGRKRPGYDDNQEKRRAARLETPGREPGKDGAIMAGVAVGVQAQAKPQRVRKSLPHVSAPAFFMNETRSKDNEQG